ncbi:signal peptidase I [Enterococcus sp. 7F3_DIV0205]|uniref:Signal peptidase I n=1 Tax=Candidatus Enterococcus palustris TaxID=1834189 RepID=A0AAQ3WF44_9ENTE|nr:signal peptidase I [Enterococcus sp. 7F3_DIV0205]OTN83121.1 hypothetical protein A5821_003044 [Enterococcus sp. 7F3_DIV0205]
MKKTINTKKKELVQQETKRAVKPKKQKINTIASANKRHRKSIKKKQQIPKKKRPSQGEGDGFDKKRRKSSSSYSIKNKTKNKRKKGSVKKAQRKRLKQTSKEIVFTIIITLLIVSVASYFTVRLPKMEGYAMTKALNDKDRLLVNKWGEIKRFKLIYFKVPQTNQKSIRRVIGLPGEELYYKNDELYINNKLTPERFLEESIAEVKSAGFLVTQDFTLKQTVDVSKVPQGKYFVLGDNRQFASDSRNYGLIDEKDIIGVVELRYFPFHTATGF